MSQKNTVQLNIRIDKELKENAERVLADFGITPSSAISMLYSQIVMRNEFPLELKRNKSMTESISDKDEKASDKMNQKNSKSGVIIKTPNNMFI
jgi:addiction module RelB/DinJ family antitoxin